MILRLRPATRSSGKMHGSSAKVALYEGRLLPRLGRDIPEQVQDGGTVHLLHGDAQLAHGGHKVVGMQLLDGVGGHLTLGRVCLGELGGGDEPSGVPPGLHVFPDQIVHHRAGSRRHTPTRGTIQTGLGIW